MTVGGGQADGSQRRVEGGGERSGWMDSQQYLRSSPTCTLWHDMLGILCMPRQKFLAEVLFLELLQDILKSSSLKINYLVVLIILPSQAPLSRFELAKGSGFHVRWTDTGRTQFAYRTISVQLNIVHTLRS